MADPKPRRRIPEDELADYVLHLESRVWSALGSMTAVIESQEKEIKKLRKRVKNK